MIASQNPYLQNQPTTAQSPQASALSSKQQRGPDLVPPPLFSLKQPSYSGSQRQVASEENSQTRASGPLDSLESVRSFGRDSLDLARRRSRERHQNLQPFSPRQHKSRGPSRSHSKPRRGSSIQQVQRESQVKDTTPIPTHQSGAQLVHSVGQRASAQGALSGILDIDNESVHSNMTNFMHFHPDGFLERNARLFTLFVHRNWFWIRWPVYIGLGLAAGCASALLIGLVAI